RDDHDQSQHQRQEAFTCLFNHFVSSLFTAPDFPGLRFLDSVLFFRDTNLQNQTPAAMDRSAQICARWKNATG
ncbi:MAG: hypothetical protein J6S54_10775, partial [Lentisphaeria bacterium]|nr:hypothetical protein [Lentisphaeria bacterium]